MERMAGLALGTPGSLPLSDAGELLYVDAGMPGEGGSRVLTFSGAGTGNSVLDLDV